MIYYTMERGISIKASLTHLKQETKGLDFRLKYPPADTGFQGHQQHTVQTKAGADHHPVDWQ
jgi:hypothetical protein